MRVSEISMLEIYLGNLENARSRWFEFNRQVSTGKKLQRPSDGPADSGRVIRIRGEISQINQYFRNINNVRTKVGMAGEALNSMRNTINKITERGAYGLTGTISQDSRNAIVNDLKVSLEGILQVARTTVDGKYIFSGTEVLKDPLEESGGNYTYVGNSAPIKIEVGRNQEIQINVTGDESFIKIGTDLVNSVVALIAQFEAGDLVGAKASLETIQGAAKLIDTTRFRMSGGIRRADEAQKIHEDRLFQLTSEITQLEDVNMAEAITKMTQAETALRAALGAGARMQQQNLFDVLG